MRRAVIRVVAAVAALSAGVMYDGGVVWAHDPGHSLSCEGARIIGTEYDANDVNTATISIDGAVVFSQTFGTSIDETVAVPQDAVAHSVHFAIEVVRGSGEPTPGEWEYDVTAEVGPCGEGTTTTSSTTTTTTPETTTTTPGSSTTSPGSSTTSPGSSTSSPESSTTSTTVPGLSIAAFSPVCLRDAPYVDVTFGDQPEFNGHTATVTFIDLDGNVVETHTTTFQAGETRRFVYPGAEVDANGNPVDWPGWVWDGDEWVIDPTDARLRDGLTVRVDVNPTATGAVTYPPATPDCDASPPDNPPDGTLPETGSASTNTAAVAAAFVAGGLALVALARLRVVRK
jgi:LPXTG-motif cell wall-anchored protein